MLYTDVHVTSVSADVANAAEQSVLTGLTERNSREELHSSFSIAENKLKSVRVVVKRTVLHNTCCLYPTK